MLELTLSWDKMYLGKVLLNLIELCVERFGDLHGHIRLYINESQEGKPIILTDSYWSYISLDGGERGSFSFLNEVLNQTAALLLW